MRLDTERLQALITSVCALRFFYGVTLRQDMLPERIVYACELSKLPAVLSADEVVRFPRGSIGWPKSTVCGCRNRICD